jgi:hypothetical protein
MRAACVDERRNREAQLPAALSKDRATLLSDMGSSLAKALLDE